VSRRAKVAWLKRNCVRKNWTTDKVEREARRACSEEDCGRTRKAARE
jgi:hypothetical protein